MPRPRTAAALALALAPPARAAAPTATASFQAGSSYANLRQLDLSAGLAANAMVDGGEPVVLRWGFDCRAAAAAGPPCVQSSYRVLVPGAAIDTGAVASQTQQHTIESDRLQPATHYEFVVQARVGGAVINSTALVFFTAPLWASAGPTEPTAIWAPRNASGGLPTFAFLRTTVGGLPPAAPARVVSALAFITAMAPTANFESRGGEPVSSPRPPKVLAAYKL